KVSIRLTDGTVDQGDLITLNITLVLPANAKSGPSMANQAADDAFVAWMLSSAGRAQLNRGGYPLTHPVYIGATSADTAAKTLPSDVLSAFRSAGGTTSS
ncbi:MAG: hypothetical protein ACLQCU_14500, partial [Acidimicrobiales bacterium]